MRWVGHLRETYLSLAKACAGKSAAAKALGLAEDRGGDLGERTKQREAAENAIAYGCRFQLASEVRQMLRVKEQCALLLACHIHARLNCRIHFAGDDPEVVTMAPRAD